MPENVKIIVSDERSQEEGKKVEVIKNGEFIADTGEEIVQSLEEIQKDLEELSLRSIIDKDKSIGEEDKEILKKSITDEGGLDFATLMKENVHRSINDMFKDTSKGLHLLLPIFFTTDKDSIEHEMDLLDVTYEGITYYLKDEYKRLAQSLEGDEEYKLYLVDPVKLNDALEVKELLIDGKNKKLDIFVEFLNIINSVEEMRDEEFGKLVTEKAYKSAIRLIYGKYLNDEKVYLTPNMTYNPRLMKKEKGYIVNGSVAILIPKYEFELTEAQKRYISSDEFRTFYKIARNYQTRSLNIDKTSCYWFGINLEV